MLVILLTLLVPVTPTDIVLVSTPDGEQYPPPCVRSCAGVSKVTDKDYEWNNGAMGSMPGLGKLVDISECQFNSKPVVTATLSGKPSMDLTVSCPGVYTMTHTKDTFEVKTVGDVELAQVVLGNCDVHWIAHGYICAWDEQDS